MNIRKFTTLACSIVSAFLVGCTDDFVDGKYIPNTSPLQLSVDKTVLSFTADAQSSVLKVTSLNIPWTVTNTDAWLSISPASGSESVDVTVAVQENKSDTARTAFPSVASTGGKLQSTINLTVSQSAAEPYIKTSEESVVFTGSASAKNIKVESNYKWSCSSSASWLTATKTDEGLKISVSANDSQGPRDAYISITAGNLTKKINITQRESNITSTISKLSFGNNASSQTFTLTADAAWTSQSSDWISVSPESGNAGKTDINLVVTNNNDGATRSGYVYFYIGATRKLEVAVTQTGIALSISPSQLTFAANGSTEKLTITSNSEWSLSASDSWLQLDRTSGSNNATINATAQSNLGSPRSATITLYNKDGAIASNVSVTQAGTTIKVQPSSLSFGIEAAVRSIYISSEVYWSAESDSPSWLTINRNNGKGDAEIIVSVTENYTGTKRYGNIIIKDSDNKEQKRITVEQTTYDISVSISELVVSAEGGTKSFDVKANSPWSLSAPDWVELSPSEGIGDASVSVRIFENQIRDSRYGTINVLNSVGNVVSSVSITQSGSTRIDEFTRELGHTFLSKGEILSMSPIESASWSATVTKGHEWISLSPMSGNSNTALVITANDNPSGNSRQGEIQVTYGYNRYTCPIYQAGKTIILSSSSVDFFAKGGTSVAFTITADKTATISTDASWIKINQSGNSFTLTAESTSSSSMRSAIVTVTLSGVSNAPVQTITVRQAAKSGSFSATGFDGDENWNN